MSGAELAFTEVLKLAAYLIALWYAGRLSGIVGLSTIPAEIGIGLIFGPSGLDLIHTFSHEYVPLQFLGFVGVSLVIFESGMHLDIRNVLNLDVGGNAIVVACLGTVLPIVCGIAFFTALGFESYPEGLAAGFSLAPTSVGIGLSLLTKAKQLHSHYGQIIISAAFLDDIFSIICLVVLINLAAGSFDPVQHTVLPLIYAFLFVGLGAVASVYVTPPICAQILKARPWMRLVEDEDRTLGVKDELQLSLLFFTYLLFSWIGDFIGSSLLGAFVAGMLFSNVPRSHLIWVRQFKRAVAFLLKIFFGATVAFTIKLSTLFTLEAFWKGLVMAIVPCLGTKLLCAFHIGSERWIVGVAMMARGEFAYLVAEQANTLGMLSDIGYSVIVWSLLWATVLAPMVFSSVLKRFTISQFKSGEGLGRAPRIGGGNFSGESSFIIRLTGTHHVGMVREICDTLSSQALDVLQSSTETDGIISTGTFVVAPREAIIYQRKHKAQGKLINSKPSFDGQSNNNLLESMNAKELRKYRIATDLDDEKLDQIAHALKETIADDNAVVLFEATEKEEEVERLTVIEIKLFGERNQEALRDIMAFLMEECELDVRKAIVDHSSSGVDYSVFYCSRVLDEDEDEVAAAIEAESDRHSQDLETGSPRSAPGSPSRGPGSPTYAPISATGATGEKISAGREKSGSSLTGMISAGRLQSGASIAGLISARRENSTIRANRENTNASIIRANREGSSASIALRSPAMMEKTIEVKRKDTARSEVLRARAKGEDVPAALVHAAMKEAANPTHVLKTVYSTFTAEQRDFIREGIRNIYSVHGLKGGQALVKMIHEEDMDNTISAAEFLRREYEGEGASEAVIADAGTGTKSGSGTGRPQSATAGSAGGGGGGGASAAGGAPRRSSLKELTALVNESNKYDSDVDAGQDPASSKTRLHDKAPHDKPSPALGNVGVRLGGSEGEEKGRDGEAGITAGRHKGSATVSLRDIQLQRLHSQTQSQQPDSFGSESKK